MRQCELCGAEVPEGKTCREFYAELAFYTLAHPDRDYFIHQLIVDAYGAQHATENSKPIGVAFALIGLYLVCEKNYTGRQAQLAHIQLAQQKRGYPKFALPAFRGTMNAADVAVITPAEAQGFGVSKRDEAIKAWAAETWKAFSTNRPLIIETLAKANFKEIP